MDEQQKTRKRRRQQSLRRLILLFACAFSLLFSFPLNAEAASRSLQMSAAVGYNGYYDDNHLVPVAVTLHNPGSSVHAVLRVTTSHPSLGGSRTVDGP